MNDQSYSLSCSKLKNQHEQPGKLGRRVKPDQREGNNQLPKAVEAKAKPEASQPCEHPRKRITNRSVNQKRPGQNQLPKKLQKQEPSTPAKKPKRDQFRKLKRPVEPGRKQLERNKAGSGKFVITVMVDNFISR